MLKGKIKLGKVDVMKNLKLRDKYETESFPDIRIFHPGFDYGDGPGETVTFDYRYNGQTERELIKYGNDLFDDLEEEKEYAKQEKDKKSKMSGGKKKKSKKNNKK